MKIKRYRFDADVGYVVEKRDGPWVQWPDVEKLLALRTAEAAELEAWRAYTMQPGWTGTMPFGLMEATNAARRAANIKENA